MRYRCHCCVGNRGVIPFLFIVTWPDECRISVTVIDSSVVPDAEHAPVKRMTGGRFAHSSPRLSQSLLPKVSNAVSALWPGAAKYARGLRLDRRTWRTRD